VSHEKTSLFRSQLGIALQAILLMAMVFVCTTIGWLIVAGPRRAKNSDRAIAKAPAPTMERKAPSRSQPPAPPEKVVPAPTPPQQEEPRSRPEPERPIPSSPPPAPERMALTYEKHILPVLQRSCLSCHGDRKKRGGLDLRTLASVKRGGESGAAVHPGKPDDSPLLETVASNRMPPGKRKLTEAEKQLIRDWIAGGAKGER
jgi:hypothetical protein